MSSATLQHIWRHPVKSHGCEMLEHVQLTAGKCLPFDRHWAIYHDSARIDLSDPKWVRCVNFSRGAKTPGLMAITASMDEQSGVITFSHPDLEPLNANPDITEDAARILSWVMPLMDAGRAAPKGIYKVEDTAMTDTAFASVSINSLTSLNDLAAKTGFEPDMRRFRGNLWIDGWEAWAENDLIGKRVQIGEVILEVKEPIERCLATTANPASGIRDADTLGTLERNFGHRDFGVYSQVIQGGQIETGSPVTILT